MFQARTQAFVLHQLLTLFVVHFCLKGIFLRLQVSSGLKDQSIPLIPMNVRSHAYMNEQIRFYL